MWERLIILFAVMCMAVGAPLSTVPCPESCECIVLQSGHMEASCSSQHFLDKLQPEQVNAIISLDLSSQNITKLNPHLKKLHNLKTMNLSNNQISNVRLLHSLPQLAHLNLNTNHIKNLFYSLPKTLKQINLSNNYLTFIPSNMKKLPSLQEVNFNKNPMSCDCDNLSKRDQLKKQGVILNEEVYCHAPKSLKRQRFASAVCEFDYNSMQGDEPMEGSGDEDEPTATNETDVFDDINTNNDTDIQDEELIPQVPKQLINQSGDEDYDEEGSGDAFGASSSTTEAPGEEVYYDYEGSGDDIESTIVPISVYQSGRPRGCMLSDCSTPSPINNDTDDASPPPGIIDGLNIVYEDITGNKGQTTEEPTEEPKEQPPVEPIEVETDKVVPAVRIDLGTENVRSHEANKKSEDIQMETQKSSLNTTFIVVAALLAIMVGLIIYSVMKKRNSRRRRVSLRDTNNAGNEMKPLKPVTADPITNGSNGLYEKVPLMNGKNGKAADEPITHDDTDSHIPYADEQDDDVELRHKNDDDSLLPSETQRVTIKVTELSTPKTPLLVNRQRTGDGLIITTPSEQSL